MRKITAICLIFSMTIGFISSVEAKNNVSYVIQPQYDYVTDFNYGITGAIKDKKWSFIDPTGNDILKPKYPASLRNFSEGFLVVENDGMYGYIDKNGIEIVAPQYIDAYSFSEGMARVERNGKMGFIDQTGKEVIPLRYDVAQDFSDGLAMVSLGDTYMFVDKSGNEVIKLGAMQGISVITDDFMFKEGFAKVNLDGKWGFIDKTGVEVVKRKYDSAFNFNEGMAVVKSDGKWGFIDKSGKEVVAPKYDSIGSKFSEGLIQVMQAGKWGFVDQTGRVVIKPQYSAAENFSDGLASVKKNGEGIFVDRTGKEVIKYNYDLVHGFKEGLAPVLKHQKWGFIDKTGKEVFEPQFDLYHDSSEGLVAVRINDLWGFVANPAFSPSDWAKSEVDAAIVLNLVPDEMKSGYTSNISRADFSKLAVRLLERKSGKSIAALLTEKNKALDTFVFSDTSDPDILAAYSLGIVGGKGNGIFDPYGDITRQEAAVMLARTANALGISPKNNSLSFSDNHDIASWAKDSVTTITSISDKTNQSPVMGSTGNNNFSPKAGYTRQQAFITVKRLFNAF